MNDRARGHTFTVAGVALALATGMAVCLMAAEVNAQTRPAYTKNVDEPGLVPYSFAFNVSQNSCGCTNCCFVRTPPVPAGKRLVIRNVSGSVALSATANLGPVTLEQLTPAFQSTVIATLTPVLRNQWNGGNYPAYEFNDEVLAYVEPGNTCQFTIYTGGSWDFRGGRIIINGYLVTL